jgi:flavin-dependent dehydrogenase
MPVVDKDRGRDNSVFIAGASIAGLFAAYHLARAGKRVHVYEAQAPFQPAERTLIVTPTFLRLLDFDAGEAILHRTDTFELISRSASARVQLSEPDVVIERSRLMRLLAQRAQAAGAQIHWGARLQMVQNHRPEPLLCISEGEAERTLPASCIIGADGADSIVARDTGLDGFERVALVQARVRRPADLPPNVVRVWFDRALTRFFLWLIPESEHTAAAGLIADSLEEAEQGLQRLLASEGLEVIEQQEQSWVPLYPLSLRRPSATPDGHVFLVGDAAGQVKVTTVGGVVAGMRGALALARALCAGSTYAGELRPLRSELFWHAFVRHMLDGFSDADYDLLLRLLNHRAVRVLGQYDRDRLAQAVWRVFLAQPGWFLLGLRALARGLR